MTKKEDNLSNEILKIMKSPPLSPGEKKAISVQTQKSSSTPFKGIFPGFANYMISKAGTDDTPHIKSQVKKPLTGLKLAPYYGCLLLRPQGIGIDDIDNPKHIEALQRYLPYGFWCAKYISAQKMPTLI